MWFLKKSVCDSHVIRAIFLAGPLYQGDRWFTENSFYVFIFFNIISILSKKCYLQNFPIGPILNSHSFWFNQIMYVRSCCFLIWRKTWSWKSPDLLLTWQKSLILFPYIFAIKNINTIPYFFAPINFSIPSASVLTLYMFAKHKTSYKTQQ